jgi:hypothetical protein
LATSEEDFRRILNTVPHDTATAPERRQPIVDTIFARSDKGFGIKEQQMSFHTLRRYIVRHEKCIHLQIERLPALRHMSRHQDIPLCELSGAPPQRLPEMPWIRTSSYSKRNDTL